MSTPRPDTAVHGPVLEFDFPGMRIGVAEYAEGPTGCTAFHFPDRAKGAVDVRGGLPGTYNVDMLRLGYDYPVLDAIGISGGSWYGLQAASGMHMALKQDGLRTGALDNLANVAGAIIYDYGDRRLNELQPDVALGAAAIRAAREGVFPLGAHGAGRMTVQGMYFGLPQHTGQGGAFRQIGAVKIACFVVANPVGLIVDREGRIVTGGQPLPPGILHIQDILTRLPLPRARSGFVMGESWTGSSINASNTTISVVVTNAKLPYAALQRLGFQVHASMGRAIQPFATVWDGDVLFAVTTDAVDAPDLHPAELGTIASEVMWDALLSVMTPRVVPPVPAVPLAELGDVDGRWVFDPDFALTVRRDGARLSLEVAGPRAVLGLQPGTRQEATIAADGRFVVDGPATRPLRDGAFLASAAGGVDRILVNPGAWQQTGARQPRG